MAEREQPGIENVAPESSVPRQNDASVSKVCWVVRSNMIISSTGLSKTCRDTEAAVPSETVSCQEQLWLISTAGTMREAWLATCIQTSRADDC